jgi:hypothetical protein
MTDVDVDGMRRIAEECVSLVSTEFGQQLDWSLESLATADAVCGELLAGGPLNDARLELWWKLVGAYAGEVLIRAYDGRWIRDDQRDAIGVSALGVTAFPFSTTLRLLRGDELKSLASLGRALPAIKDLPPRDGTAPTPSD